tara:strand:+ start:190 stop:378 length:189 start_codon:yes stop_codon:yes gene_type:complete
MNVKFDLSLEGCEVVSVNLVGERPEASLPHLTGLRVFKSNIIFVVRSLRSDKVVEISDIKPE